MRHRRAVHRSHPPNNVATGTPATWPAMSHSAASSGQYRPAWKSIVSSTRTWRAIASGSCAMNRCSNASNPSIVSPEPRPVTPSSVSTRTIVTGNSVRGTGSQAAAKGGSSGTRSRWSRMALILTSAVSPTGSRRRAFGLLRYPDRSPRHPETL